MWRKSLIASSGCIQLKGFGNFYTVRSCSSPPFPADKITALQALATWREHFIQSGVTEPEHSSQYIIAHLLGAKTIESLGKGQLTQLLDTEKTQQIWQLCTKRLSRMPVQYVIEEWDFRDLTLKMRPPVFIPRPETEGLVDLVLRDLQQSGAAAQPSCLEVGCGSGAISLSLLKSLPQLKAVAVDQNQDAVKLTRENAVRLNLLDRVTVHHMDVLTDSERLLSLCSRVSVVVSNPPYLFSENMESLEPEIIRFEDPAALDGGHDGLRVVRQILTLAPEILCNRGRVYLEVDPRHPPLIQEWVEASVEGLHYLETRHDIAGRARYCVLQNQVSNEELKQDLD